MNKQIQVIHLTKQIEYTQKLINTLNDIKESFAEVCKKYDGKIYTKRFANAVQAINPLISVDLKNYGMLELRACDWNNRHYKADAGQGGYVCTSYVKEDSIIIYLDSTALGEKSLTLKADTIINNFNKALDGRTATLNKKIDNLKNIDTLIKEFADIKSRQENFNNKVDMLVREIFSMKF